MQSVSSIFDYNSKAKLAKLSSLMKFRTKPHMIFCSSKLPKDFFGEQIQGYRENLFGGDYKFVAVNKNSEETKHFKKIKYASSVRLLS